MMCVAINATRNTWKGNFSYLTDCEPARQRALAHKFSRSRKSSIKSCSFRFVQYCHLCSVVATLDGCSREQSEQLQLMLSKMHFLVEILAHLSWFVWLLYDDIRTTQLFWATFLLYGCLQTAGWKIYNDSGMIRDEFHSIRIRMKRG